MHIQVKLVWEKNLPVQCENFRGNKTGSQLGIPVEIEKALFKVRFPRSVGEVCALRPVPPRGRDERTPERLPVERVSEQVHVWNEKPCINIANDRSRFNEQRFLF